MRIVLLASVAAGYALLRVCLMSDPSTSFSFPFSSPPRLSALPSRPPSPPFSFRGTSLGESQLVRRAENPLAFVEEPWAWFLSLLYVQACQWGLE